MVIVHDDIINFAKWKRRFIIMIYINIILKFLHVIVEPFFDLWWKRNASRDASNAGKQVKGVVVANRAQWNKRDNNYM